MLGAALLDAKLEEFLRRRLSAHHDDLLGRDRPLTLAQIRIALAVGLISDDAASDFEVIRGIRNDFAHSFEHELDFSAPSIADRCRNLKSAAAFLNGFDEAAARARSLSPHLIRSMQSAFTNPRKRFELAVDFLTQYLDDLPAEEFKYNGADLIAEVRSLTSRLR